MTTTNAIQAAMTLWGSDCLDCGNTTPEEMICDYCWSDEFTMALYHLDDAYDMILAKLAKSRLPKEEGQKCT